MSSIKFEVRVVPAGTGPAVWDDPDAGRLIQRFMPKDRNHGPMIGILQLGAIQPTPRVLREVVVTIGEDIRAGRYGDFTFVVSSDDDATRNVIGDIASAQGMAVFISSTSTDLETARAVGDLTSGERETLGMVLRIGGTVTVAEFAGKAGVEQTTAGNRLVTLHKKGFLHRVKRAHPLGDQFIDPRSVRFDMAK